VLRTVAQATVAYAFPEPARAAVSAATGTSFNAKVVQWPMRVPDTDHAVVFSVVGRTYFFNTLNATVRSTTRTNALEFAPAVAPNGQQVLAASPPWVAQRPDAHRAPHGQFAHAVWSDADFGFVEIVTVDRRGQQDGAAIRVPADRGRYTNPRFSPDVRVPRARAPGGHGGLTVVVVHGDHVYRAGAWCLCAFRQTR
jgi:hypothetical protein